MKLSKLAVIISSGLAISACDNVSNDTTGPTAISAPAIQSVTTAADNSEVMATVNGKSITKNLAESYLEQRERRRPGDAANNNMQATIEELINLELSVQDGESKGIDKQPDIVAQIQQQRKAVIGGATIKKYLADNPVTDEEMQALYDEKTGGEAGKEFKARHILVKTEEEAKDIISKLESGADFSELAKELSTGPTGKNGGDLGWFSAAQMVQPFSETVAKLEKGSYTKTPVETQFGWHVIVRDDSRDITPPPFEQLKPQISAFLQKQRLQNYLDGLREKATIDIQYVAPAVAIPAIDSDHDHSHDDAAAEHSQESMDSEDTVTTDAVDAVTSEITEAGSDAVEAVTEAGSDAVDAVTSGATEAGSDAVDAVTSGVTEAGSDAVDAVTSGATEAGSDAVDAVTSGATEAGSDAANTGAMGSVTSGAEESAQKLIDKVKSGVDAVSSE